ncbi:MAG TPA: HlyD family efflux transporter periplasmic adaptor subunit [Oleiagrimonas sp.]|nr:HlyD family efflux transporter periplasmic adaptor subunit [Oleiagrimonas sp.]
MTDSPVPSPADADKNGRNNGKRKRILLIIAIVFIVVAIVWVLLWLFVFSQREKTDDAYVGGNQVTVSAQVGGTVTTVLADDTQRVDAGQVLVKLDSTDADVALSRARSALARAVRQVRQLKASAAQADAGVAAKETALAQLRDDLKHRAPLAAANAVAPETLRHLKQQIKTARSALTLAKRQSAAAHAAIDGTDIEHNPIVLEARAAFRNAWLAAHRTAIVAPVSGYVAQRSVQVGQQVKVGQPLMQVIPLDNLWVDANFKESQLAHIRIGQPATFSTDVYGDDVTYHGHVLGLAAGTGSAFALLPPQNASGNWIKVVQRVPVRINIDQDDLDKHPLRVGLSASVTVDTHDRDGKVLATAPAHQVVSKTSVYTGNFEQADRKAEAVIRANLGKQDDDESASSASR